MKNINQRNIKQSINSRKKDPLSMILFCMVYLTAFLSFSVIAFIVIYILIKGAPHLSKGLFALTYTNKKCFLVTGSD